MTEYIFRPNGNYLGFISDGNIFSRDGEYLGWIEGNLVWDSAGRFRGQVMQINNYKYILRNRFLIPPIPKVPRIPPIPPSNIVPIIVPIGFEDAL